MLCQHFLPVPATAIVLSALKVSPSLTNAAGTAKWTTNGDAFNNVGINFYWASTTSDAFDPGSAWCIDFVSGGAFTNPKTVPLNVWPVRGGQSGEFGSITIQ